MTYIQIGIIYCLLAFVLDFYVLKTKVLKLRMFWLSYVIVLFFQFVTNGILTKNLIVRYNDFALIGGDYSDKTPPMIGDGRLFYAPVEDVFFGFTVVSRRGYGKVPSCLPFRFSFLWSSTFFSVQSLI